MGRCHDVKIREIYESRLANWDNSDFIPRGGHNGRIEKNVVQNKKFLGVRSRKALKKLDGNSITPRSCKTSLLDDKQSS